VRSGALLAERLLYSPSVGYCMMLSLGVYSAALGFCMLYSWLYFNGVSKDGEGRMNEEEKQKKRRIAVVIRDKELEKARESVWMEYMLRQYKSKRCTIAMRGRESLMSTSSFRVARRYLKEAYQCM
jgi:hypothetical protein